MKVIQTAAICLMVLFSSGFTLADSKPSVIQERLKASKNGDYIVLEANKMISILAIRSLSAHSLILEEITVPAQVLYPRPASWSDWVSHRAPGHSSWSMIEIDLETHQPLECYSFSRSTWVQLGAQDSLIATLLDLPLLPTPKDKQRRIGPAPLGGETDFRKLWKPPLIVHGERKQDVEFDVYETTWPSDGSELSGHTVSLYFDHSGVSPFPVWIQIDTSHATASLRIIDSGKNLPILHKTMPRRVPEFVGHQQKTPHGLRLSLKSPKYFRNFELYVVDVTKQDRQLYPIVYSLMHGEGELLHLEIDENELQSILQADHRYTWLVVPTGQIEFYSESNKSFLWKRDQ
jgi:hypothetical protein